MTKLNEVKFGVLPTPSWHKAKHEERYGFSRLGLETPTTVELQLPLPDFVKEYDQGNTNACTGYSSSWMQSINNKSILYDAMELYHEGQITDGDPITTPEADNGGYVFAVMDVLRKRGPKAVKDGVSKPPNLAHGIESYYWIKNADEVRTAISKRRAGVFAVPWYESFMNPILDSNGYWLPSPSGAILGYHAICFYAASDKKQATRWANSWGEDYPLVWVSYSVVNSLLERDDTECTVAIDLPTPAPNPAPVPVGEDVLKVTAKHKKSGRIYKGKLERE